jgi:hypothetical protein
VTTRPSNTDLVPFEDDEVEEPERTGEEVAREIADATADLARLSQEVAGLAAPMRDTGTSQALVPSNVSAQMAKTRLAKLRADATRQQAVIESKQDEIRAKQQVIERLMREQMALAREQLAPLEKYVARLSEGIWMVNLYLGRDEEIVVLRSGEPAPSNEPVLIRQLVLAMDEESAINPDDDGIDATNIDAFDNWLASDPAHVDQIAPEQKCVVALRPRFRSKSYEDPWKQAAVAEADKQTYFLIRNGENLYRTWTEFNVGERLVPNADEFTSFFFEEKRKWGGVSRDEVFKIPIKPGTLAWERAEEAADARKRHFMRVGLILQGLVDRTTVFHPLPEGGINFLDFEDNGKTWRFLMDAEMALTTGRKPFYDWLREKNANLRVGMRVVGSFTRTYTGRDDMWQERIRPRGAERPPTGELLTIEEKTVDGWIVRYKRTEKIYKPRLWIESEDRPGWGHYGGYVEPKQRASCLLFHDDTNFLPFDLVTEEEMAEYLNARLDRHAYADMFPLLKAAIRAKRAEREEEAPFRTMLAGVLARDNDVSVADAAADLDSLIEWWKLTNKNHRPLVGDEHAQAQAVRMIVAEHARRLVAKRADNQVVARILAREPGAILVARRRDGKYVALVPENDDDVFVREAVFGARTAEPTVSRWKLVSKARILRWHVAYETERYREWDTTATLAKHLTGPEFDRLAAQVMAEGPDKPVAVAYDPKTCEFHTWRKPKPVKMDLKRPFSSPRDHRGPELEHVKRPWKRQAREAVLGRERPSNRGGWIDQRKPWDTRTEDGKPSPYRDVSKNLYVVVHYDPVVEAEFDAELARWEEASKVYGKARKEADALLDSIKAAWVKRREAVEYNRFLEDFLDPDLWEGHLKTLPQDTFAYPHRHYSRHGWGSDADAVGVMVEHAVETGIDLNGLTVQEAAEKHFPPAGWLKARGEADAKPDDIPEDILDLRFAALPADEDDDEDDDE